jgi:predicted transcriptional regulator
MTVQKLAYTFEEAAVQSGYSERTIRNQVRAGNLLARYANSKGVIRHEDLAEWLDSLPAEPPGGLGPVSGEPITTGWTEA